MNILRCNNAITLLIAPRYYGAMTTIINTVKKPNDK